MAPVKRFVAVVVLAGCATGTDTRLGGDATSQPDGPIDAMVDAPDACVPTPEICDGVDNDCDGQIDEDFHVGMPCDGPDRDLCKEGMIVCAGPTATMCTDTTGDSVDAGSMRGRSSTLALRAIALLGGCVGRPSMTATWSS